MSEKKSSIFTDRPTLDVQYQMKTAFFRRKKDEEPTLSSGSSANLRIDLVRAAIVAAIGVGVVACTAFFNKK